MFQFWKNSSYFPLLLFGSLIEKYQIVFFCHSRCPTIRYLKVCSDIQKIESLRLFMLTVYIRKIFGKHVISINGFIRNPAHLALFFISSIEMRTATLNSIIHNAKWQYFILKKRLCLIKLTESKMKESFC